MILSKDAILGVKDLKTIEVDVPEWGGVVIVKELSGKQRDEFEQACLAKSTGNNKVDPRGLKALLLSLTIVDEKGDYIFSKEDLDLLNDKSASAINKIFEVSQNLSALGLAGVEEKGKN